MSIKIIESKCVSCGKCLKVCPGNLIYKDENKKAYIKYPRECWGCTACLKECQVGAIKYYLEPDVGGCSGYMYAKDSKDTLEWTFVIDGSEEKIKVNKKESNKY
ncbi:4Fe-4S dicluster domain-containing protein [Clostridium cylindrosporum]|uniref:Ferredoxin n=1 Tax=Clostridium cylindrosporum DSM 605 TaxID=1121307 RepID=A0A0J8DGL3_CLOCY|nr:ferredoxin family protein [Clostridium cylindrosporum]KMT23323.1 ferredoxin [Clostridium cylindrosporum DSM 605]